VTESGSPISADHSSARQVHWDSIYKEKPAAGVSWYQSSPEPSLGQIQCFARQRDAPIIDIGGGASLLADRLLEAGFTNLTVLDVSEIALSQVRARLGTRAREVRWIVGDVITVEGIGPQEIWHDRAVFHFLTDPGDRRRYVERVAECVIPGGHVLIAAFALDGPKQCSGLPVERYDVGRLASEFGSGFALLESEHRVHVTPWGAQQPFTHAVFRARNPVTEEQEP
jgi:SAM-dependent methyltransferase